MTLLEALLKYCASSYKNDELDCSLRKKTQKAFFFPFFLLCLCFLPSIFVEDLGPSKTDKAFKGK
jgi:hypothetical protein